MKSFASYYKKMCVLLALLAISTSGFAVDFVDGVLNYSITSTKDLTVKVVAGSTNYQGDIVIPKTVNYGGDTYRVTAISNNAFYTNTDLNSIVIGDNVTAIGFRAFQGCTSLKNVTLGSSVTSIDYSAFQNCTNLNSINLHDAITFIGSDAFYGCVSL